MDYSNPSLLHILLRPKFLKALSYFVRLYAEGFREKYMAHSVIPFIIFEEIFADFFRKDINYDSLKVLFHACMLSMILAANTTSLYVNRNVSENYVNHSILKQ